VSSLLYMIVITARRSSWLASLFAF